MNLRQLNFNKNPDCVKPHPRISLRLYANNSDKVTRFTSTKTKRIFSKARHEDFAKAYLRVSYKPDAINEGFYFTREELLGALEAFLSVKEFMKSNRKEAN